MVSYLKNRLRETEQNEVKMLKWRKRLLTSKSVEHILVKTPGSKGEEKKKVGKHRAE